MVQTVSTLLGGIGFFLLGMTLLTDGVKAFAGDSLRMALLKFTGKPLKAFLSGTLATLLVQSSSATTVTVIGFVSAGLLTFPQALGMVFGASLGTTGTGWVVSVLGLKVNLGSYTLPFVGVGAFMRILGRGRWKAFGLALAGFGLIFIGIDFMQRGMEGLSGILPLAALPSRGFGAHVAAMAAGIALTAILQSSSATVAITLTALNAGTLNFEQSASLVIGAAIGTTITAALAAIGANNPAKRTALAFVLFNLCTSLIAIVLLPVLLALIGWEQSHLGLDPGATSLAAFHTTFIAMGVLIFLPLVDRYAALVEWLLPDHQPALARYLDKSLLQTPAVAMEAVRRTLRETALATFQALGQIFPPQIPDEHFDLRRDEIALAINEIQRFVAKIPVDASQSRNGYSRAGVMHAIDHLVRLQSRIKPPPSILRALVDNRLRNFVGAASSLLQKASNGLEEKLPPGWLEEVETTSAELAATRRQGRMAVLDEATGSLDPEETLTLLDAMRWMDRIGYHTWRICHHLTNQESNGSNGDLLSETHPDE
jgi:phosphate:Na+ symporter